MRKEVMSNSKQWNKILFNKSGCEKVSGYVKKLVDLVNELPYNSRSNTETYEDFLLDDEFMFSVFAEVKKLNIDERNQLVKGGLLKPNILPYVHYDIYLTEKSFIKDLPESSVEFYQRDDYDFDQYPYPFQDYIFESGRDSMNELYEAYNKDSYADLKEIYADLREDLRQQNLMLYTDILNSVGAKPFPDNKEMRDQVETLSNILLWLYGGGGLGEGFMYLIDKSLTVVPTVEDNTNYSSHELFNKHRLNGAKIYFRIYLIEHLLKMKKFKFTGNRVGLNYFLEDYEDMREGNIKAKIEKHSISIKPDKDEVYLFYSKIRPKGVRIAFYEMENFLKDLNLNSKDYYKTDTPENFDKAYRDWYEKIMKENSDFLNKGSQLHDFWKSTSR